MYFFPVLYSRLQQATALCPNPTNFCMVCELRMAFLFFNGWKIKSKEEYYLMTGNILWNSNFSAINKVFHLHNAAVFVFERQSPIAAAETALQSLNYLLSVPSQEKFADTCNFICIYKSPVIVRGHLIQWQRVNSEDSLTSSWIWILPRTFVLWCYQQLI